MKPIVNLESISDIRLLVPGWKARHPLVAVIDFSSIDEYIEDDTRVSCEFYSIMFKNYCANSMRYGRKNIDFQDGNLVCIAPRQVVTMDNEVAPREDKMGWGLFFHPDLIRGTSLDQKMKDYTFFSYDECEALHLSDKEKKTLIDCIANIEKELEENIDQHSQNLIVSNIELLLNYCLRFYGRQFITRKSGNRDVVTHVDQWLRVYFATPELRSKGLPSVKDLADQVHLSPSYLSDLLKKETGKNGMDHIHYHLIEAAKSILRGSDHSVSEVAFSMGFEYSQYFSTLFKKKTGMSPNEYRKSAGN